MNFYKEIEPFIEYLHSIRKLENYLSFDMEIPIKWGIPKSVSETSQLVPFDSTNEKNRGLSFVCEIKEIEINNVFVKISKIIKINKEREIKERLFKDYVEKLKNTFEKNNLDKLQNLYFEFNTPQIENEIDYVEDGHEPENIELAE